MVVVFPFFVVLILGGREKTKANLSIATKIVDVD